MLENLIFHIPHSSIKIPSSAKYLLNDNMLTNEILKLTDLETDKIFNIENTTKIIFDYNRVFCDVERLPDEQEEMFKVGRGFYYTHTDEGLELRDESDKETVRNLYNAHHTLLEETVQSHLLHNDIAVIIDCHSFSDTPFDTDLDKAMNRPDICIGTDEYHTPPDLIELIKNGYEEAGFNVRINSPYSGTIVPLKYYKQNPSVKSIMIEINRKLFYRNGLVDMTKIIQLNRLTRKIFQ